MVIRVDDNGTWEVQDGVEILVEPSEAWLLANQPVKTEDDKKNLLRATRDALLDEADTKYCNADKWELMSAEAKALWRTWKQNMRDWVGIDLDLSTFPEMPL